MTPRKTLFIVTAIGPAATSDHADERKAKFAVTLRAELRKQCPVIVVPAGIGLQVLAVGESVVEMGCYGGECDCGCGGMPLGDN